jgi:hypothetical protein
MGEYFRNLPVFGVRSEIEMELLGAARPARVVANRTVKIARPNRFSFVGEQRSQFTVVSDGDSMITFLPAMNRYVRGPAFPSIDEILRTPLASIPGGQLGSFVLHLAANDPVVELMKNVVETRYAGMIDLDGVATHRLEFLQNERQGGVDARIDWTLWIQKADPPILLQLQITTEQTDPRPGSTTTKKIIITERFLEWDVAFGPGDESFRFVPPEGAREVEKLYDGPPPSGGGATGQRKPPRARGPSEARR